MKTLAYFLTAILLIGGSKLIEIFFYEQLKAPHPGDREYHGEDGKENDYDKKPTNYSDVPASQKEDSINTFDEEPVFDPINEEDSSNVPDNGFETEGNGFETQDNGFETEDSGTTSETEEPQQVAQTSSLVGDAYFRDLQNSYLNPILAGLPEGRAREDVVIRYYQHQEDDDKVYKLRKLGYYLHEREAEDNKGLGSNVLYYGSDVDVRDIQLVAYTLVQNNVPLKSIERSQYDWKFNAMEIGADSLLNDRSVLTLADIRSFSTN